MGHERSSLPSQNCHSYSCQLSFPQAGYLEKFLPRGEVTAIVEQAAEESEKIGRHEDAIRLFDLAQVHSQASVAVTVTITRLYSHCYYYSLPLRLSLSLLFSL
jgi:hypothetical protein